MSRPVTLLFLSFFLVLLYFYPTPRTRSDLLASAFADTPFAALGLPRLMQSHWSLDDVHDDASNRGPVSFGYFVNWGIYARGYKPLPGVMPVESLTHILYAFADVRTDTGEVFLTDSYSDEQIHYPPGDSWNEPGNNLYGNLKQLNLLKRQNRNLKLLLSIGGYTYGPHFPPVLASPTLRAKFVSSSVQLLEDYGLDGLDIDYEYPANAAQAADFVSLLKELKAALVAHAKAKSPKMPHYQLTTAAPCGPQNYNILDVKGMDPYLDYWNLMAYDYAGSWEPKTGYQDNIFGAAPSSEAAVHFFQSQGVASNKIVLGFPLYGRIFQNTDGVGKPYNGIGQGTWEAGIYDYRVLPQAGATEYYDAKASAAYSYNNKTREFVTYDTPQSATAKVHWIKKMGLGGVMYWELSGDVRPQDANQDKRGLVRLVAKMLGKLDSTKNHLSYPGSKWDNVRNGFQ